MQFPKYEQIHHNYYQNSYVDCNSDVKVQIPEPFIMKHYLMLKYKVHVLSCNLHLVEMK
jgi:hypothetical protein